MRKYLLVLSAFLALQSLSAEQSKSSNSSGGNSSGKLALGLTLLGPTGITGKYTMNDKLSIESSLGLGILGKDRFHLHGVLLYNFYKVNESLSLYAGGGAVLQERGGKEKENGFGNFLRSDNNYQNSLGVRAPIGISWKKPDKKIELSAEVYFNVFLIGRNGTNAGLALACRYFF